MLPSAPYGGPYRMGQTFDEMFNWSPAAGDMVRLAFHGMTAYLGFYVGSKEKGFLSGYGWVLGFGQAIGAVCDVVSLIKRATGTHPPELGPNEVNLTPGLAPFESPISSV